MEKFVLYKRLTSSKRKETDETYASAWVSHYVDNYDGAFRDILHLTLMMAGLDFGISVDVITLNNIFVMFEELKLKLMTLDSHRLNNLKIHGRMVSDASNLMKLIAFYGAHYFIQDTNLRNYLFRVLGHFSNLGIFSLRYSTTIVATSIITGLIEKSDEEASAFVHKVLKDVKEVFFYRWKDTNSKIRVYMMNKLNTWIDMKPGEFIRGKYIKRTAWLLRDKCSVVLLSALDVAINVLCHPAYFYRIEEFVESLSIMIQRLILIINPAVTEKITKIYVIFSRHFPSKITSDHLEAIVSVLLSLDNELCSQATVPFFLIYVIGDGTTNEKIRYLVKFTSVLKYKSSISILVHTLLESGKCDFLTDWYTMISILVNEDLTDEDRFQLTYIMNLCAEKVFIQGACPMMRKLKVDSKIKYTATCRRSFTSMFMINFPKLLSLKLKEEHYAQLIYALRFINPKFINSRSIDYNFVNLIAQVFENSTYEPLMESSVITLHALSLIKSNEELSSMAKDQLTTLCTLYKERSINVISDFVEDVEKYYDSEEIQREFMRILRRNRNLMPVSDKDDLTTWVFNMFLKILEIDLVISSFTLNLIEECLVGFFSYFKTEFEFIENNEIDNLKNVLEDVESFMSALACIGKWAIFYRHGQIVFCSLTLTGNKLSILPETKNMAKTLFVQNVKNYLDNFLRFCIFEEKGRKLKYNMNKIFKRNALSEYLSLIKNGVMPMKGLKYIFLNIYKDVNLFCEPVIEHILEIHNKSDILFGRLIVECLMDRLRSIQRSKAEEDILDMLENCRVIAFTINLVLYPHREFIQDTILQIHQDILDFVYRKEKGQEPILIPLAELLYCVENLDNRKLLLEFVDEQENPSKVLKHYRLLLTSNLKFSGKFLPRYKNGSKKPRKVIDPAALNNTPDQIEDVQRHMINLSVQRLQRSSTSAEETSSEGESSN